MALFAVTSSDHARFPFVEGRQMSDSVRCIDCDVGLQADPHDRSRQFAGSIVTDLDIS